MAEFQDGDIVRHPDYSRTRFRLVDVQGNSATFKPVRKDGTRDRRWDVGFSGSVEKCVLIERYK